MARSEHVDDYALSRVPTAARKHWFGIAVQRFGQVSALSQFLLGATLGYSMTFMDAFWSILFGSLVVEVIMAMVGIVAMKEGLNTALLARWTGFGEVGASLVGLAVGISLIGWFGIQSAISADSLNTLMPDLLPVWIWSVVVGLAVTAICAFGFVGMQWIANVTVPLFLLLVGWSVTSQLWKHDLGELVTGAPAGPSMSVVSGSALVAGGIMVGAIITGDMTRFNRSGADVIKQTVVGTSAGEFGIGLAGVLLAHAARTGDVVAIITTSVGFVGLLIVITGTLKINDWNLYSSALGLVNFVSTTFRVKLNRMWTTIVLGVVGTILGAAGILGQFESFLSLLGVAFPPIAGIMVAEYFVVKKWRPELEASRSSGLLPEFAPRIVPATLVIWAVSAVIGYVATWGIPPVLSLLLAMVLYSIAGRFGWVRGVGTVKTPGTQPQTVAP
ncbi:purine-cytosine permease family protein [Brachybacterium sp. GCM10030267]|uniref:purine-cytosine permease family protein n=1 Tax=unclassified Brachybacterium TaxID=2623841 RepID=UPI00361A9AF4